MIVHRIAEVLLYLGVIGVAQFAAFAFSARQLSAVRVARLQRRLANPLVRHARPLAAVSAVALVAGIALSG